MRNNATTRFTNRVEDYVKYRPQYPMELLDHLQAELRLGQGCVVADVGSGTGISTEFLLRTGAQVCGIEPNKEMRQSAERMLTHHHGFRSLDGFAEDTQLESCSVDLVTAFQAFHWFHRSKCTEEFKRILKPDGRVVLIWNDRRFQGSAFLREYEELIVRHSTDYGKVNHRDTHTNQLSGFFRAGKMNERSFHNFQEFGPIGLLGRVTSSSYMPVEGDPGFPEMRDALESLFSKHQVDGQVRVDYDTRLFYGQL